MNMVSLRLAAPSVPIAIPAIIVLKVRDFCVHCLLSTFILLNPIHLPSADTTNVFSVCRDVDSERHQDPIGDLWMEFRCMAVCPGREDRPFHNYRHVRIFFLLHSLSLILVCYDALTGDMV